MLPTLHSRARNADKLPCEGNGVRVSANRAGMRENCGGREAAAPGIDLVHVLQRTENGVRHPERLHRDRPPHSDVGSGGVNGRGGVADGERRLRRRAHVHARALRARHRVRGLGIVLHDEPGWQRRTGT